jgi:hypothetical protein
MGFHHSGLTLAVRIAFPHFPASPARSVPNSVGDSGIGFGMEFGALGCEHKIFFVGEIFSKSQRGKNTNIKMQKFRQTKMIAKRMTLLPFKGCY